MAAKIRPSRRRRLRRTPSPGRPTSPVHLAITTAVALAGFVCVCAFWHYLATGQWADLSLAAYRQDLARPFSQVLFRPVSIFTHPWMALVIALTAAALTVVPIMVAVVQRLLLATAFILVVAVVGHAPVLALALAVGAVLAARTRLRADFPFVAMALGVLPAAIYMIFSIFAGSDSASVLPIQRWILPAPYVGAVLVAAPAFAIATVLGRFRYLRELAAILVLGALAAGAVGVFYAKVGPDELAYAFIADGLSADDKLFHDVSLADWKRRGGGKGLNPMTLLNRVKEDLQYRRLELFDRCGAFMQDHPRSSRAPEVLWIQGQCMSLKVRRQAYEDGLVSYDASYTGADSADIWRRLVDDYGGSPQAALAQWHLAALALRDGKVGRGDELLRAAAERLQAFLEAHPPAPGGARPVFSGPSTVPSTVYYADVLFKVRRLVWQIQRNHLYEDARAAQAFGEFLGIDASELTRDKYLARLKKLIETYEDTPIEDNLRLAIALAAPKLWGSKIEMLVQLARETNDAAVEANFHLGELTMEEPVLGLELSLDIREPRDYFNIVIAAPPSPWRDLAEQRLALLQDAKARKP